MSEVPLYPGLVFFGWLVVTERKQALAMRCKMPLKTDAAEVAPSASASSSLLLSSLELSDTQSL